MFRALTALTKRVGRARTADRADRAGRAAPPPRREPTRMELDLYGAIVGKSLREGANDPGAPPAAPRRNVHVRLSPRRRPWWRQTPVWVWDRCRALLDGAGKAFPMSPRARAAWLEVCRRLSREQPRGTRGAPAKRPKRK